MHPVSCELTAWKRAQALCDLIFVVRERSDRCHPPWMSNVSPR